MHATAPRPHPDSRQVHGGPLDERGAMSSLELLALTPMLATLVALVLWAGNNAQAGLVADLAAEEAAVAAALCCNTPAPDPDPTAGSADLRREHMAEAVLAARPGLDWLCLAGPQPHAHHGYLTETFAELTEASAADSSVRGARVVEVHFDCEADGAAAPMRGLLPTVTVRGRAAHLTVLTEQAPTP